MNAKQRSILAGRRPKMRYSRKREEPVYGVSPLRACCDPWKWMDGVLHQLAAHFGVPGHLFKGDEHGQTEDGPQTVR